MERFGQQHLKMSLLVVFDGSFIGNELMKFGHPVLIDIHQRVEPEDDSGQLKKEQVQGVPLLYVHQFVRQNVGLFVLLDVLAHKNVSEKGEGRGTFGHCDFCEVFIILNNTFMTESANLNQFVHKPNGSQHTSYA